MREFGLIGRSLGHSFSKAYFEHKFAAEGLDSECRFLNFELASIDDLAAMLAEHPDLRGFSVTIPYKKEIIPLLSALSDEAREIGAVNCVRVENTGGTPRLKGFNTDAHGFRVGLDRLLGPRRPADKDLPRALVLGTGGASRAVRYVLADAGIGYWSVSRNAGPGLLSYDQLTPETIASCRLIVNTTPLGTFPATADKPAIPYNAITDRHCLYDLVYNPAVTAFLAEGASRGAKTLNGETMLHAQAEQAWEIWNSPHCP